MNEQILWTIGGGLFAVTTWASVMVGSLALQRLEAPVDAEEDAEANASSRSASTEVVPPLSHRHPSPAIESAGR